MFYSVTITDNVVWNGNVVFSTYYFWRLCK